MWRKTSPPNRVNAAETLEKPVWSNPGLMRNARQDLLSSCWSVKFDPTESDDLTPYESYFDNYEEHCVNGLHRDLQSLTHHDLCAVVQHMSLKVNEPYNSVLQQLTKTFAFVSSEDIARKCIAFVGKAILLLNLSTWRPDESLKAYMTRTIGTTSAQQDRFQLPVSFNARNLKYIGGIGIQWVPELLAHLTLDSNMESLRIFPHVKVLDLYEGSKLNCIFPKHFLEETRDTISLMLPISDRASRQWFQNERQSHCLDNGAMISGRNLRREHRHIQHFDFWRDRLIDCKEAFDRSQPRGLIGFWRDNRNPVQWWTFWIAIVVFILTVIGVVESAL